MEEKELWMNKLKEKLADYSEPAPASGWEQLEKELMPPVEKKIYPYRKWMMAAAAIYNISCRFVSKSVFSRDTRCG